MFIFFVLSVLRDRSRRFYKYPCRGMNSCCLFCFFNLLLLFSFFHEERDKKGDKIKKNKIRKKNLIPCETKIFFVYALRSGDCKKCIEKGVCVGAPLPRKGREKLLLSIKIPRKEKKKEKKENKEKPPFPSSLSPPLP